MSELKHLDLPELVDARRRTESSLKYYQGKVAGQKERLKWINKYIKDKEGGK